MTIRERLDEMLKILDSDDGIKLFAEEVFYSGVGAVLDYIRIEPVISDTEIIEKIRLEALQELVKRKNRIFNLRKQTKFEEEDKDGKK